MKHVSFLRILTAAGSILSTLAVVDLSGIARFLAPGEAKWLLMAGPAALALKELVVALGDLADDGKPNKSFKARYLPVILALLALPLLPSCSAPPPVQGEFIGKDGRIRLEPDGRIVVVVEPRTAK